MTLGTMTLIGLIGSLVLLKLGLMAFALGLVARGLLQTTPQLAPAPLRSVNKRRSR
jgi:hypothetical protein